MKPATTLTMADCTFRIALDGTPRVLSVSDSVHALLGFEAGDFLSGKVSLPSRIHAHDLDIADDLFAAEIRQPAGVVNLRLRKADGRIRCVTVRYTKVRDAKAPYAQAAEGNGTGVTLELLVQDAKSLWQQQGAQPLTANFKAMMENTDDYIYFKDRNHVFTGASQTLVAITKPAEHWTDLLGQTDYDVFPEAYADIYYRLEKQIFAGQSVAHEVQETLDNDGNKGWVDNRKYPLQDGQGELIGLFGIARDITGSKRAEATLREAEARRHSETTAVLGAQRRSELAALNLLEDARAARAQSEAAATAMAQRNEQLSRFNKVAVERELTMIALKQQVNALARKLGRAEPYKLAFLDAPPAPGKQAQDSSPPAAGALR